MLLGLDVESLKKVYSKDAEIDGLRVLDDAETVREIAGIVEYRATPVDGGGFEAFLADFTEVEFAKMDLHSVNLVDSSVIVCHVFVDFRAKSHDLMRHDRGWANLTITKEDGQWKLANLIWPNKRFDDREGGVFDVTEAAGLDTVPLFPRLEALRRGGYAITVGDVDSDGDVDVYVGGWGKSQICIKMMELGSLATLQNKRTWVKWIE